MRRWIALAALAGLACAGSGRAPEDHFYRLPLDLAAAPRREAPLLDGTLAVERPLADGVARGRAVAWSDAPGGMELRRHRYHYWAAPPPDLIQEGLASWLRECGVARAVITPELRLPPDYVVTGRLLRFERELGAGEPAVAVELRLSLQKGAGAILWSETYQVRRVAGDGGMDAAAAAFGAALQEIYARFAADLARGPDATS